VSSLSLQTEACVLLKRTPSEKFQQLTVFSVEHGALGILQRVAAKATTAAAPLDLFDTAALRLESSNQGQTWFVAEARVLVRRAGIGRSYDTLRFAAAFTSLVARNPGPDEGRAQIAALLTRALDAFAAAARPDIVHFKSLYCFARDEGYPVKQQWVPTLAPADRATTVALLNRPLAEQTAAPESVARLQRRLEDYLRGHTDILLD
jgi:hypothetical protein